MRRGCTQNSAHGVGFASMRQANKRKSAARNVACPLVAKPGRLSKGSLFVQPSAASINIIGRRQTRLPKQPFTNSPEVARTRVRPGPGDSAPCGSPTQRYATCGLRRTATRLAGAVRLMGMVVLGTVACAPVTEEPLRKPALTESTPGRPSRRTLRCLLKPSGGQNARRRVPFRGLCQRLWRHTDQLALGHDGSPLRGQLRHGPGSTSGTLPQRHVLWQQR